MLGVAALRKSSKCNPHLNHVKVSRIVDPAGRITQLSYDEGNLTQITDPDASSRTFEYDNAHHITAEIDKRSNREESY